MGLILVATVFLAGASGRPARKVLNDDALSSAYVKLAKQEVQMDEISRRLGGIEASIHDVQGDVKQLMETNHVMKFLITVTKLLVPGLVVAAFGVWFKWWLERKARVAADER